MAIRSEVQCCLARVKTLNGNNITLRNGIHLANRFPSLYAFNDYANLFVRVPAGGRYQTNFASIFECINEYNWRSALEMKACSFIAAVGTRPTSSSYVRS